MSTLVFGCPNCQQPFQVGETQAGQVVQCPSCAQTVEIPASAFEATTPPPEPDPIVFACPTCQGQFGITKEMDGQQVACPHCQSPALIQLPSEQSEPEPIAGPMINTNVELSRREKKKARKRAKSIAKTDPNLFAPGAAPTEKQPDETSDALKPKRREPDLTKETFPPVDSATSIQPDPRFRVETESDTGSTTADAAPTEAPIISESVEPESVPSVEESPPKEDAPDPIDHLLPPKFSVFDPNRMRTGTNNEKFKVFLPDGQGGTAQLDNRVLRVNHGDEKISLVVLTEAQKARRRLIQNIVAILIGIAIMALAFTLLM